MLLIDDLRFRESKTKEAVQLLKQLEVDSALVVDLADNRNLFLAMRNLPQAKAVDVRSLNVYDILKYNWLVISQQAFSTLISSSSHEDPYQIIVKP